MKGTALLLYLFVTAINVFLFFPVIFYPVVFIPLHLLVWVLSYSWLFKNKKFRSRWSKFIFATIPVTGQIIIIISLFSNGPGKPVGLLTLLDNLFILVLSIISFAEFVILLMLYSKYLREDNA
jgi:hypothetical protein